MAKGGRGCGEVSRWVRVGYSAPFDRRRSRSNYVIGKMEGGGGGIGVGKGGGVGG